jgi:hypothetical protein
MATKLNQRSGKEAGTSAAGSFSGPCERTYTGPDLKLTTRQRQTHDAFVALHQVASSAEQLVFDKDTPAPEAVISKAVAQIPARLLRGVLVKMTRDTLHNETRTLFLHRQNERTAGEARDREDEQAELRDKLATLIDAIKLLTKIADAI